MVLKIIARRLKVCPVKPSNISISSFHRVFISSIRGSRKTSISMLGCLGPYIRMDNRRYFSLLAQPRRQIVHRQYHWPRAVGATSFTERIHSIRTQRKPNVSRIIPKFMIILVIEFLPLSSIRWMSQLSITLLALIWIPPSHQLSVLWVREETPKAIGNWEVPHNHGRNFALLPRHASSSIVCLNRWHLIVVTTITRIGFVPHLQNT